jgi:hypothetical protein
MNSPDYNAGHTALIEKQLNAVLENQNLLEHVPEYILKDERFILDLIEKATPLILDKINLKRFPLEIKENKKIVLSFLEKSQLASSYIYLPDQLKEDKDIIELALCKNFKHFRNLPKQFRIFKYLKLALGDGEKNCESIFFTEFILDTTKKIILYDIEGFNTSIKYRRIRNSEIDVYLNEIEKHLKSVDKKELEIPLERMSSFSDERIQQIDNLGLGFNLLISCMDTEQLNHIKNKYSKLTKINDFLPSIENMISKKTINNVQKNETKMVKNKRKISF